MNRLTRFAEVQAYPACPAQPGDQVDVVGFPGAVDGRPGLQDAICRKVARGQRLDPVTIRAAEVLSLQNFNDPSGNGQAAAMRYDTKLVRIEGILLQASRTPAGYNLVLQSGNRDFLATMPAAAVWPRPAAANHMGARNIIERNEPYIQVPLDRAGNAGDLVAGTVAHPLILPGDAIKTTAAR
jgi:hypothetical protein